MNKAFLRFRLRQMGKFIRELPVFYLLILTGLLFIAGIALYEFSKELKGSLIIGTFLLIFLSFLQLRRKDYHFTFLAEEKPWKVFCMDYILFSTPILIVLLLHSFWYISVGIIAGCLGISFIKQSLHRTNPGITSPTWIPVEAFEVRSGIRQRGVLLLTLYISAWFGLLLPFVSLALLWLLLAISSDIFRYSESEPILFAQQRPAKSFLHRKIVLNLKLFLPVIMPICLVYVCIYPAHWWLILSFLAGITLNVTLFIVIKYAYYWPNTKITAGQVSLTIALLSILLPVLLPVIPLFLVRNYIAARRNLTAYLYAYNP